MLFFQSETNLNFNLNTKKNLNFYYVLDGLEAYDGTIHKNLPLQLHPFLHEENKFVNLFQLNRDDGKIKED